MEEDIQILEDFIKYYEAEAISRKFRGTLSISVDEQDIQALENLLTRYKQLEKQIDLDYVEENYIEKSKIKEKIEEWDKSIKWANADDRYYAIKILQELLEEDK